MNRFEGRVVLLTGAARGIGGAAAELFAREGARVVVTDYDPADAQASIAPLLTAGLAVEAEGLDVTQEAAWASAIDGIIARHGRLDVLVNNAGVGWAGTAEDCSLDMWRATMAVNMEGVFLGTRKAIEVMKARGGSIVNVASIAGNVGEPLLAAYNASKGGVRIFTKAAALHCAQSGYPIRVNSLHPGYTVTKLVNALMEAMPAKEAEAYTKHVLSLIPMGRLADPMEIARPLVFLASDDASYMTGSELVVDGGYIAA
jgi:NAD(P)-dependent dehydrogenase (short-subunit alcohol dehydrogenase family)